MPTIKDPRVSQTACAVLRMLWWFNGYDYTGACGIVAGCKDRDPCSGAPRCARCGSDGFLLCNPARRNAQYHRMLPTPSLIATPQNCHVTAQPSG
jgi:hypothetical protein